MGSRREQRREQGWPDRWNLRLIDRWERAGGTVETAQELQRRGWSGAEVLEMVKADPGYASGPIPPGQAALYKTFGDGLHEVVSQSWPRVDEDTVLSVKQRFLTGTKARHLLDKPEEPGGTYRWRHWVREADSDTWSLIAESMHESPQELIAARDELHRIRSEAITEFHCLPEAIEPEQILASLVPDSGPSEDPDQWPRDVAEVWALPTPPFIDRWCRINDLRVCFLGLGESQDRALPVGVARSAYPQDWVYVSEWVVPGCAMTEIAHYSWFSESGFAPVTWGGTSEVYLLDDDYVLLHDTGDAEVATDVVEFPTDPVDRARFIADWIHHRDAGFAAAMYLEPFDPEGTLSPEEQDVWAELQERLEVSLSLDTSVLDKDVLRRILQEESSVYETTLESLRNPKGKNGQAFAAELEKGPDGPVWALLQGTWGEQGEGPNSI